MPTGLNTFTVVGLRGCGENEKFELFEFIDVLEMVLLLQNKR